MPAASELIALLRDLVQIESVNPDLIPGASGEEKLAIFIAEWARQAGLEATLQPLEPGRANVIVHVPGSGGGKTLMLNGHIDTVGLTGMDEPFSAKIEGSRLYGRGAYDMKAGVAACLITARRVQALKLRGDLIITAVADEEVASKGTQAIIHELDRWRPDAVIVTEPTELELATAHKGFQWFSIETTGVAAHGSRPQLGVDAIMKMGKVLAMLDQYDQQLRTHTTHPLLGTGSAHASLIQGGQEMSSYPAACTLQLERRSLPGESANAVQHELQALLDQCARQDRSFQARLSPLLARDAFESDLASPFVQLCQQQLARITGKAAQPTGVSFWADSALFAAAGIPTVLLGPIGAGAHGSVEWVDLDSAQRCVEVYTAVAQAWCG